MFSFGNKALKTKQKLVDVTKYSDIGVSGDPGKDLEKNNAALVEISIEGGKTVVGTYDETGLLVIVDKSGALNTGNKDESKNTEEENKIKSDLENSGLSSDPLSVGISKVIKAKIENNSTLDTKPDEIDAMLIKILEDIEEEEKLLDSMEDTSDDITGDNAEDIEQLLDLPSHIEQVMSADEILAEQKIIDLKTDLGKIGSEKKYLEKEIQVYEDYEKKGASITDTQTFSSLKTRLDEANKRIDDLQAEIQKEKDKLTGTQDEENTEDQETEDTSINEVEDTPTEGEGSVDTSTDSGETGEITEEAIEEVITLNGTLSDGVNAFTMSMTINLGTGAVSGILYIRLYIVDLEYQLEEDVPISGSMDLETRDINAQAGDSKLTGTLSADGNSANGTASGEDFSAVWSVSR